MKFAFFITIFLFFTLYATKLVSIFSFFYLLGQFWLNIQAVKMP